MSFILNALRKSEQERQARQPETVTDRILIHHPQQSRTMTARFFAFLIIGNALIISSIVLFVQNNSTPTTEIVIPNISKSFSVQESPIKTKSVTTTTQREIPEQKTGRQTPSIAELVETQKPKPAPLTVKPVITKKTVPDVIDQAVIVNRTGLTVHTPPVATATVKVEPDSSGSIPVKRDLEKKGIPYLSDLPFEFRQTIPKFNINVFVYSQRPDERFVMIDMVKYKPGQQIKDALLLKEIRPDSLVIVYQNQIFQIERP